MRRALLIVVAMSFASCPAKQLNRPPATGFYFPSGIHHQPGPSGGEGVLYVVSANFDRRYDTGLLSAIDLDAIGLPPFGAPVGSAGPLQITNLMVTGSTQTVALANFG